MYFIVRMLYECKYFLSMDGNFKSLKIVVFYNYNNKKNGIMAEFKYIGKYQFIF